MRRILFSFSLLGLFGCGGKSESQNGGNLSDAASDPKASGDRTPKASSAAPSLWTLYGDNAASADAKYKGKYVRVNGDVGSVVSGERGYTLGFETVASGLSVDPRIYNSMTPEEKKWFNEGYP